MTVNATRVFSLFFLNKNSWILCLEILYLKTLVQALSDVGTTESDTEEYWPCNAPVFYFCSCSFLVILTKDAAEIMLCTALSYKDLNAIQSPVLCHEFSCTVLQVLCIVQKPNSWTYNFKISFRCLGIILRVLRLDVSEYNVYITNQIQTKEKNDEDFWLLPQLGPRIRPLGRALNTAVS